MPKVVSQPRVVSIDPTMQASHHAHVIQVSDEATRRSSAVMVVRETPPQAKPAEALAVAQASVPQPATVAPVAAAPAPAGDSVRRVSLDNAPDAGLPSVKQSSPKFVFAN